LQTVLGDDYSGKARERKAMLEIYRSCSDEQPTIDASAHAKLEMQLQNAFEHEPLEDGIGHAAEGLIREALHLPRQSEVLEQLRSFALNDDYPSFAASVLRCLGRQQEPGTSEWRADIVRSALEASDVQIRDAAVQASEEWGGPEVLGALRNHVEPVV